MLRDETLERLEGELDDTPTMIRWKKAAGRSDELVAEALDEYALDELDTDLEDAVKRTDPRITIL